MQQQQPKLYTDLPSWFHLLTAPSGYVESASYAVHVMQEAASIPKKTVLELGSGGDRGLMPYQPLSPAWNVGCS